MSELQINLISFNQDLFSLYQLTVISSPSSRLILGSQLRIDFAKEISAHVTFTSAEWNGCLLSLAIFDKRFSIFKIRVLIETGFLPPPKLIISCPIFFSSHYSSFCNVINVGEIPRLIAITVKNYRFVFIYPFNKS